MLDLHEEVSLMFESLVVPDMLTAFVRKDMIVGEPSSVGIRTRSVGRSPEAIERARAADRDRKRRQARMKRLRQRARARWEKYWSAIKAAPLQPFETVINGELVVLYCNPKLEKHRERSRNYRRSCAAEKKAA